MTTPLPPRLPPLRTLGEWRRAARTLLRQAGIPSAGAEADTLARHVLACRRHELTLHRDRELASGEKRRLSRLLHRRLDRVPLQYLTGEVDFYGLTLTVGPGVLIPRPETEGLVERVLAYLPPGVPATVVDVGTGSGAVACALASERPELRVWAVDLSRDAVSIARRNVRRLGLEDRVTCLHGDLLAPVLPMEPGPPLRVVVSNPPYVSPRDRARLDPEVVDHEPGIALFAPDEGMEVIRRLVSDAAEVLPGGGLLALEIGEDLGGRVRDVFEASSVWRGVRVERDLAGRDRYALGIRA